MIGNFNGTDFFPGWEPLVRINQVSVLGDRLMVLAEGTYGSDWMLWSSTNLVDWIPAGGIPACL